MVIDPVADALTRIRNAIRARHDNVVLPKSKLIVQLVRILEREGFLGEVKELADKVAPQLQVQLRYTDRQTSVITDLKRVSKPGLRIYAKADKLPRVWSGLGIAVISTSRGIMTDRDARKAGIGGEVLCYVW
jgi:small subunit ribosomal protein S8